MYIIQSLFNTGKICLTNVIYTTSLAAEWGHSLAADHTGKQMRLGGVWKGERRATPCGVPAGSFGKVLYFSFHNSTKSAEAREREASCPLQASRKRLNELKADIWEASHSVPYCTAEGSPARSLLGRQGDWVWGIDMWWESNLICYNTASCAPC